MYGDTFSFVSLLPLTHCRLTRGGMVQAQLELARRYASGDGVEQNSESALFWFEQAAEHVSAERVTAAVFKMYSRGGARCHSQLQQGPIRG